MKLYELEHGDKFRLLSDAVVPPDAKEQLDGIMKFGHIDGMYSYCLDSEGEIVHPAAWSEVEKVT